MAGLVKDYQKYKTYRNVTFLGICTSTTGTLKTMEKQIEQYNLKPFANMLDAGGATATAYHLPRNAPFRLVVLDGEGKFAYNASQGWHWSSGPDAGKFVHYTQLEKSLKTCTGILGLKEVPAGMEQVAHLFDLQQFQLLEAELKKNERKDSPTAAQLFAAQVRDQIVEHRKTRVGQIKALAELDPLQAYREAESFAAAFPGAPERPDVVSLARDIARKPDVHKELLAESVYQNILVPEMKKAKNVKTFVGSIQPLLDTYLKTYGETRYGAAAKGAVEAHGEALSRGR